MEKDNFQTNSWDINSDMEFHSIETKNITGHLIKWGILIWVFDLSSFRCKMIDLLDQ